MIFKITEPGDILRAEAKFYQMIYDIEISNQNSELNLDSLGVVVNYGYLLLKQMENSIHCTLHQRKKDGIIRSINSVIEYRERIVYA